MSDFAPGVPDPDIGKVRRRYTGDKPDYRVRQKRIASTKQPNLFKYLRSPMKSSELEEQEVSSQMAEEAPVLQRQMTSAAASMEEAETEESTEMSCVLNAEPDPSIITMITGLFHYLGWPLLTREGQGELKELMKLTPSFASATSVARKTLRLPNDVVLINSCHGGLLVIQTRDKRHIYKTFLALSELFRIIKSVPTCCSYILPDVREQYLKDVIGIIKKSKINALQDKTNEEIINKIRTTLRARSIDLPPIPKSKLFPLYQKGNQTPVEKRTVSGSTEIYRNSENAFDYVENNRGDPVINKLFSTDEYKPGDENITTHQLAPRGMLFCNNVTINVNNRWFAGDNPFNEIITNEGRGYEIGNYDYGASSIQYTAKTNLLSCPYFMFFASRKLGQDIIQLNNSLSLGAYNKRLIPMVTRLTAEVLYWYLSNQPFLFVDMSCESLCFRNEAGHGLNTAEQMQLLRQNKEDFEAIKNRVKSVPPFRGGNRKTRYNTKKYKKRRNTKTKRYKTKKHRK